MDTFSRSKTISTVVVGAGIGGLAAAISLSRKGHTVTVLESKPELNEFGASIGITPNGTRVLTKWGLLDAFMKVVTVNDYMETRDGISDKVLGRMALNEKNCAKVTWGAEALSIHRADYQRVLAEAAVESGSTILFSAQVIKVDLDPLKIHLADGRQLTADLIVAADGMRSAVRACIPELADIHPKPWMEQTFRCTVPKERMRDNPKLSQLLAFNRTYFWSGPGRYILAWPLTENSPFDVVASVQREGDVPPGKWGVVADPKVMAEEFADFCPTIVELLAQVDRCIKWTLAELPPLPVCRSANGRVILLGDAFHAMIPHTASGGVSAIEDGAVIGECVDWAVCNGRSVNEATAAYEFLRKPRVERMQRASHDGYNFLGAQGETRRVRDELLEKRTKAQAEDLARPEEERKKDERPKADKDARWPSPAYLQWLYAYDAIGEAQKYLATL